MKRISTGKDGAFEVLVGQAAIWKVGRGIVMLAANKLLERREARFLSCHVTKDSLATCCIPLAWCKVPLGAGTGTWPSECWHETLVSSDVLFIGPFGGAKVLGVLQGSLRALQKPRRRKLSEAFDRTQHSPVTMNWSYSKFSQCDERVCETLMIQLHGCDMWFQSRPVMNNYDGWYVVGVQIYVCQQLEEWFSIGCGPWPENFCTRFTLLQQLKLLSEASILSILSSDNCWWPSSLGFQRIVSD